jgi:hypothetical protein
MAAAAPGEGRQRVDAAPARNVIQERNTTRRLVTRHLTSQVRGLAAELWSLGLCGEAANGRPQKLQPVESVP